MMNTKGRILMILAVLVTASLGCSLLSGGKSQATEAPIQPEAPVTEEAPAMETQELELTEAPLQDEGSLATEAPADYDTSFPLPDDVRNFMKLSGDSINYQTGMSLQEVMDFYRDQLTAQGLTERKLLTVVTDTTFNLVFDGDPAGAVVIQAVDLGDGTTNVNMRHEDV